MSAPVIVAARRTPIGTAGKGPLADLGVEELAAPVLSALAGDVGQHPEQVILGNCHGPGGNVARVSSLAAGFGHEVPGLTVDRQCGSGLEAITLAATAIESGRANIVFAGGTESASTAPARSMRGTPYSRAPFAPAGFSDPEMGVAADALADKAGITRARQDAYASRSHARALRAIEEKRFADEIVPLPGVDIDDRPRDGFDSTRLGRFPSAFSPGGTATAGNSSGFNDGAAAVAVVSERVRATHDLPGLRLLDWECAGCDPALPGLGPVPAIENLLLRQGLELGDIGAFEIVEAFAGQILACADALGLDDSLLCKDGGAIALGHPWGASGAILMVRLFTQLVRERTSSPGGPDLGIAAVAIGGGMGIAVLVERVR